VKPLSSDIEKITTKLVVPVPVTVSIVVICDIRVLVEKKEKMTFFPYDYLHPGLSTQDLASSILFDITKQHQDPKKWIPVDIRGGKRNVNQDYLENVLDIGYLTILDSLDLPEIDKETFEWILVNLDEKKFPLSLFSDHTDLWNAAYDMFNLLVK